MLKKLLLAIKQGFQFLNTLCFLCEDKAMFTRRQAHQILRTVIIFDTVQMVYNPTFWQRLIVELFPNIYVLKHIAFFASTGIEGFPQKDIAPRLFNPTSFRVRGALPFSGANPTSNNWRRAGVPTVNTSPLMAFIPSLRGSICTPFPEWGVLASLNLIFTLAAAITVSIHEITTYRTDPFMSRFVLCPIIPPTLTLFLKRSWNFPFISHLLGTTFSTHIRTDRNQRPAKWTSPVNSLLGSQSLFPSSNHKYIITDYYHNVKPESVKRGDKW